MPRAGRARRAGAPSSREPRAAAPRGSASSSSIAPPELGACRPSGRPARRRASRPSPSAAAAPAGPAAATPRPKPVGPVTLEQMRDAWPEILAVLERTKRTAWMAALTARVIDYRSDESVLVLGFPSQNDVHDLRGGTGRRARRAPARRDRRGARGAGQVRPPRDLPDRRGAESAYPPGPAGESRPVGRPAPGGGGVARALEAAPSLPTRPAVVGRVGAPRARRRAPTARLPRRASARPGGLAGRRSRSRVDPTGRGRRDPAPARARDRRIDPARATAAPSAAPPAARSPPLRSAADDVHAARRRRRPAARPRARLRSRARAGRRRRRPSTRSRRRAARSRAPPVAAPARRAEGRASSATARRSCATCSVRRSSKRSRRRPPDSASGGSACTRASSRN